MYTIGLDSFVVGRIGSDGSGVRFRFVDPLPFKEKGGIARDCL